MVVTDRPETSFTAVIQATAASRSICTVQAPHSATPQPYFVPVSPSSSRRYQSRGIDGSPSKDCVWALTCNLTIGSPPSSVHKRPSCSQQRCWGETRFQSPFFDERSSGRGSGFRANLRKGFNLRVPPRPFGRCQVCVERRAYRSRAPLTKWQVTLAKENCVEPSIRLPEPYKRCGMMPCKVQLSVKGECGTILIR